MLEIIFMIVHATALEYSNSFGFVCINKRLCKSRAMLSLLNAKHPSLFYQISDGMLKAFSRIFKHFKQFVCVNRLFQEEIIPIKLLYPTCTIRRLNSLYDSEEEKIKGFIAGTRNIQMAYTN